MLSRDYDKTRCWACGEFFVHPVCIGVVYCEKCEEEEAKNLPLPLPEPTPTNDKEEGDEGEYDDLRYF